MNRFQPVHVLRANLNPLAVGNLLLFVRTRMPPLLRRIAGEINTSDLAASSIDRRDRCSYAATYSLQVCPSADRVQVVSGLTSAPIERPMRYSVVSREAATRTRRQDNMGAKGKRTGGGHRARFVCGGISGVFASGHLKIHAGAPRRIHSGARLRYFSMGPAHERRSARHSKRRSRELTDRRCHRHTHRRSHRDSDRYASADSD